MSSVGELSELPGDVQWALGTAHDLELEVKALRQDTQATPRDSQVARLVFEISARTLQLRRLLLDLQSVVGRPAPPCAIWDAPTDRLDSSVPIDNRD